MSLPVIFLFGWEEGSGPGSTTLSPSLYSDQDIFFTPRIGRRSPGKKSKIEFPFRRKKHTHFRSPLYSVRRGFS